VKILPTAPALHLLASPLKSTARPALKQKPSRNAPDPCFEYPPAQPTMPEVRDKRRSSILSIDNASTPTLSHTPLDIFSPQNSPA
jgi:hypothetical protein